MKLKLILFIVFFCCLSYSANNIEKNQKVITIEDDFFFRQEQNDNRPNALIKILKKRLKHTKRAMAAVLAFPLPFGVLALHRIYLGTAPHVPVVYLGTVGGVFGILPFIDFCVLVLDRKVDRFLNNGRVFMWIEEEKRTEE